MQATLFEQALIMDTIVDVYNAMDKYDVATWDRKEAEKVVADQILMDSRHRLDPLPYEVEDFYDTIRELIRQDYGRLRLFFYRIGAIFRR